MRLLSGARPTGGLHIGQFFGAFRPAVEFPQQEGSFFIISDFHMLTTRFEVEMTRRLPATIRGLVAELVAFGIDENVTTFYVQSGIPEEAQIYAVLQGLAPYQRLLEQPSFEEMARHSGRAPSLGLLGYPILEAADIVGMQATHVAVGQNNLKHLDLCKDMIAQLNEGWGLDLVFPATVTGTKNLIGLDGNEKMSKTLGNAIFFHDATDVIRHKIEGMSFWSKDGQTCVPLEYLKVLDPESRVALELSENPSAGRVAERDIREYLFERVETFVDPIRRRAGELRDAPDYLDGLLRRGREPAAEIIRSTRDRISRALNLRLFL